MYVGLPSCLGQAAQNDTQELRSAGLLSDIGVPSNTAALVLVFDSIEVTPGLSLSQQETEVQHYCNCPAKQGYVKSSISRAQMCRAE